MSVQLWTHHEDFMVRRDDSTADEDLYVTYADYKALRADLDRVTAELREWQRAYKEFEEKHKKMATAWCKVEARYLKVINDHDRTCPE